ncbi:MAG: 30S ribosomal protein S2 [Candidatus Giovannonibacteria bacterium GW2011_GWA2_45_21]|uniref:Small ribosomal subunit protein uS2 n=1 Tax=Candidatus Giovannonibacteria bacterium GW2011_GWA2_45_21 TaxID=1618649 RepID=A0A0G1M964_9BACT|nr:MAG: 30S ribosomal protein S2 [Candidatus Giovannonibacteria bacterium GW2011_GWA2_45_21]
MEIKEGKTAKINDLVIEALFNAGAHFALSKTRRHPSAKPYIFGAKNTVEIFDLEKTKTCLENAKKLVTEMASRGEMLLLVSGKFEARDAIRNAGASTGQPFVAGRWIGGAITNFNEIRKRVEKLLEMKTKRASGEFAKYTKKEQLLLARELDNLEKLFGGLTSMTTLPKALFVVDPVKEKTVVAEARRKKIPVIALANSDCDFTEIDYPIPANDSAIKSISFFAKEIAEAYKEGKLKTQK